MRDLLLPTLAREPEDGDDAAQTARRVDEALRPEAEMPPRSEDNETIEIDMSMTSSADEQLRGMDFQMMSVAEISEAEAVIDRMRLCRSAPRGDTRRKTGAAGCRFRGRFAR